MTTGSARKSIVVVALILAGIACARTASAQSLPASDDVSTADMLLRMEQMEQELNYLRQRDAEREAWESSVVERLPEVGRAASTVSYHREMPASEVCGRPCGHTGCPRCHCGCIGFCSCLCTKEAPCIDCPRVSTLNPYFNVRIFGALKLDMLFNDPRPVAPGTPFFLAPGSFTGLEQYTFDAHARQSLLGAAFTGPQVGRFQSGGLMMAAFYNDAVIVDRYGFLPLQAYGELRNQDWRFAAGLQFDVFCPGVPTVLPFSILSGSGNPGNAFRGQARLERFIYPTDNSQWTVQFALSEPVVTTIDPALGLSEDNGWPNVEGRIAWGLGPVELVGMEAKRPFEIGVSGVVGQLRNTVINTDELVVDRTVADVWGVGGDFRWRITEDFGVMGEIYTGQALGTYNCGILQSTNLETGQAVRSTGGWFEVFVYLTPCLHSHTGYGIDDPLDRDLETTNVGFQRVENTTFYTNLIWDINKAFRVAFEFAWRETDYGDPRVPDNDGPGYHTQFQWAF